MAVLKIDLLEEIRHTSVKEVAGFGSCVSFIDLFQRLQVLYGFNNKDLLEAQLKQLHSEGRVKLFLCDGILSYIAPI